MSASAVASALSGSRSPVDRDRVARIEAALRAPGAGAAMGWRLRIGDEVFDDADGRLRRLERVEDDGGGPAVALHATIAGRLDPRLEFEDVELDVIVGPDTVPRYRGEAEEPLGEGTNTTLSAHTAGWWLDKVKLKEYTTLQGAAPDQAAKALLFRAPYDKAYAEIQPVSRPRIFQQTEAGGAGWPEFASPADPLLAVATQAGYVFRDHAMNGPTAVVPTAYPGAPQWSYDLTFGELVEGPPVREQDGKWHKVVVYRSTESGEVVRLTTPMAVPGSRAHPDAWLYIEVTDASDLGAALQRARNEVEKMGGHRRHGTWTSRAINPFISRGSAVTVIHRDFDHAGVFVKRWAAEVTSVTDDYLAGRQTVGAEMVLLSETREPAPLRRARNRTGGVRRPRMGRDGKGRFFIEESLPFVRVLSEGTVFLDDATARAMGIGLHIDAATNQVVLDNAPAAPIRAGIGGPVLAGDTRTVEELGDYTIEELS